MPRTTIAVVDSKRLVAIFGPRDQHLRRIRSALGVGVSARDDAIHIEGEEPAVLRAAEIFEELDRIARDHGFVEADQVSRLLAVATGEKPMPGPPGQPAPEAAPAQPGPAAPPPLPMSLPTSPTLGPAAP